MIFNARNGKGVSTCDLVLSGEKKVTRRRLFGRLYHVGQIYSIQPNRGSKSLGYIIIVSAIRHIDWVHKTLEDRPARSINRILQREAELEGFSSWKNFLDYIAKNNVDLNNTIRYRFKLQTKKKYMGW